MRPGRRKRGTLGCQYEAAWARIEGDGEETARRHYQSLISSGARPAHSLANVCGHSGAWRAARSPARDARQLSRFDPARVRDRGTHRG